MSQPAIPEDQYGILKSYLRNPNLSNWDIAAKYNCTQGTISLYRRKFGIPCSQDHRESWYNKRAMELFLAGDDCAAISKKLNIKKALLYSWAASRGLSFTWQRTSLDEVDRGTLRGFIKYFSNRPHHFEDVYGVEFSELEAKKAFQGITGEAV